MKHKKRILVIEDQDEHYLLIKSAISEYTSDRVSSLKEAKNNLLNNKYDLILLDLNLSDGSGLDLLADTSLIENINVIVCSDRKEISDKVATFSLGALDHVTKPFNSLELKLRVNSILNRMDKNLTAKMVFGMMIIDQNNLSVKVKDGEQELRIDLTTLEFKILRYLANNSDRVVNRNQILDAVWGDEYFSTDRVVDSHISKIRKKLGKSGDHLESIYGGGYRFNSDLKKAA